MAKRAKYSDYSEKTQQFMLATEKYLKAKYGKIEPHWEAQLEMLATNFELFMLAKDEIKKSGLLVTNRFGASEKNPMLRVIVDANIQCFKILAEFGLNPMSKGKIKTVEEEQDDVIKNLLNG